MPIKPSTINLTNIMNRLRIFVFAFSMLALTSCGGDNGGSDTPVNPTPETPTSGGKEIKASLTIDLATDKAAYSPGETITFTPSSATVPSGAKVRYRNGLTVVAEQDYSGATWTWTVPQTDNTGYIVDIYTSDGQTETIYGAIAVDVSTDWAAYPRYGFVATYDKTKTDALIEQEMDFLCRCHINGVQFYDWQYKHHWPLGGTRNALLDEYTDIANRQVLTSVVKKYIEAQHQRGMKAMFYNLCFGGLDDAQSDGVDLKWGIFTSKSYSKNNQDRHSLASSWKSDIYLYDPANTNWQSYIAERNSDVYASLDFDGYHVDQLGDRGTVYDAYGSTVDLKKGYGSFLKAMKTAHPNKRLVMNAVSGWGAEQIAASGATDFLYDEMWGGEDQFSDLMTHKKNNDKYSNGKLKTVFAAYMNYGKSSGQFNTPGILLTDAVMFAIGASHLELGDHMLCNEYFPNTNQLMNATLKTAITHYYDFLVAYEQLLRGEGTETTMEISTTKDNVTINQWPPTMGSIACYSRVIGSKKVVHLLNFRQANSLSWRDLNGEMPDPKLIESLPITLKANNVSHVWVASPDNLGGVPQELEFSQTGNTVTFTLPRLKYWDMIVIE